MRLVIKNLVYIFWHLISFFYKEKRVMILMYHSFDNTNWKYGVRPSELEKQIKYLVDNFKIVRLSEIVDFVKGKNSFRENVVAITVDDGYLDTHTALYPLLKKHNIPATVFLTTNLEKQDKLGGFSRPTWEQIKEMYDSGLVRFEVHGHNHLNLREISGSEDKLRDEILKSQEEVKNHLNYTSKYFAYAGGNKDKKVVKYLKKEGFVAGFSINEGLIQRGDDLVRLKRIQVDKTMNFLLFKMRLTKAIDLNRRFIDFIRKLWKKKK